MSLRLTVQIFKIFFRKFSRFDLINFSILLQFKFRLCRLCILLRFTRETTWIQSLLAFHFALDRRLDMPSIQTVHINPPLAFNFNLLRTRRRLQVKQQSNKA